MKHPVGPVTTDQPVAIVCRLDGRSISQNGLRGYQESIGQWSGTFPDGPLVCSIVPGELLQDTKKAAPTMDELTQLIICFL